MKRILPSKLVDRGVKMHPLDGLREQLISNFNREAAIDLSGIVQFDISDAGNYYLIIDQGECQIAEGEHDSPSVCISMDSETLLDILAGKFSGMQAFMFGKVMADGDQRLAAMIDGLFVPQRNNKTGAAS